METYHSIILFQFEGIEDKAKTGQEAWTKWTQLVHRCFHPNPASRPRFVSLVRILSDMLEEQEGQLPRQRDVGLLSVKVPEDQKMTRKGSQMISASAQ